MARLRQADALPAPIGGVPAELLDRRHPVWADNLLVARWRSANGLPGCPPFNVVFLPLPGEPDDAGVHRGGRHRHHQAANDWARVNGIVTAQITWPTRVDHRRLSELLQGAI